MALSAYSSGESAREQCLACHLESPDQGTHPQLTAKVGDQHCFGCHSRSSRISLSYAGLAEVEERAIKTGDMSGNLSGGLSGDWAALGRLPDGRLVERREADVHHRAGLACIDCHTKKEMMGSGEGLYHQAQALDIQCTDCHLNRERRLRRSQLPTETAKRVPFPTGPDSEFLATRKHRTPLWHIEVRGEALLLHRKVSGGLVSIPLYSRESHPLEREHARLACSACHSRWAPRCYGCHLRYESDGHQWDHAAQRVTPGRWREQRWGIRNGLPALGVDAAGSIVPFVPGMILSASHPDWPAPKFKRLFASIAPHTAGKARSCASCHESAEALGLGRGRLGKENDGWRFYSSEIRLGDGLPADAWTGLSHGPRGGSTRAGDRSLTYPEMVRVLEAPKGTLGESLGE